MGTNSSIRRTSANRMPTEEPSTAVAPWYESFGIRALPSFGPGILTCCHGPDEYVSIESVHQAARIYARTAAHYCE